MLEQKVVEILAALQKLVEQQGPAAFTLALRLIRIEAAFDVAAAVIVLAVVLIIGRILLRWWRTKLPESYDVFDAEMGRVLLTVVWGVGGLLGAIYSMTVFLSARTWMALLDPRLALAYDILKRVSSQK